MKLIPTILCGGAGSRLWPVSREAHPKPFIRLSDGQSLLQKAYLRATVLPSVSEVVTVTNQELFFKTRDEYGELNGSAVRNTFILEPVARNTAPAIAAAALEIAKTHGDNALMLVLPADHVVLDNRAFANAVAEAVSLAQAGKIVTFGIKPDAPETAYGYIEHDGNRVVRFVEKPSPEKATFFLASGNHLWNSGMFCFAAGTMCCEMKKHCPEILSAVSACLGEARRVDGKEFLQLELDAAAFAKVPDRSVDYAVMEKSADIAVVPCTIGWSDVGSWQALGSLVPADTQGNRIEGDVLLRDVSGCFIRAGSRMIGALGIKDLMVIDTPDALLVADRNRSQEVKELYSELKAAGHESHKTHRTVHRPWGTYTVLEEGKGFKIKRIEVKPGASLSLQMHHHRSEHWIVVSGKAKIVNDSRESIISANESTFIPAGHKHRLENPGEDQLVIIEVQSGSYLGEDDIVRFDDVYGRR